jgi:hypothetical protein
MENGHLVTNAGAMEELVGDVPVAEAMDSNRDNHGPDAQPIGPPDPAR